MGPTLDYHLGQWALILRMPRPLGLTYHKIEHFLFEIVWVEFGSLVIFENWMGQILMCTMNAKGKGCMNVTWEVLLAMNLRGMYFLGFCLASNAFCLVSSIDIWLRQLLFNCQFLNLKNRESSKAINVKNTNKQLNFHFVLL